MSPWSFLTSLAATLSGISKTNRSDPHLRTRDTFRLSPSGRGLTSKELTLRGSAMLITFLRKPDGQVLRGLHQIWACGEAQNASLLAEVLAHSAHQTFHDPELRLHSQREIFPTTKDNSMKNMRNIFLILTFSCPSLFLPAPPGRANSQPRSFLMTVRTSFEPKRR